MTFFWKCDVFVESTYMIIHIVYMCPDCFVVYWYGGIVYMYK